MVTDRTSTVQQFAMELTGDQIKIAELELKKYFPESLHVYGCLVLKNKFKTDDHKIFVDQWPDFGVILCRPYYEEVLCFHTVGIKSLDTSLHHMEIVKEISSEMNIPSTELVICHLMVLHDPSKMPFIDCSGISLGTMKATHADLVNQTWRFCDNDHSIRMIRKMIECFPSCCVLDVEGNPLSWLLTYATCSLGMLYTRPEYRGKGYAKALIYTMVNRLLAEGLPVYCYIEKENNVSIQLFNTMGFTEVLSYRQCTYGFNNV